MFERTQIETALSSPTDFTFGEVSRLAPRLPEETLVSDPSLGPLSAFQGNWMGSGFNTIFRPDSSSTPTVLPIQSVLDNLLELNLTSETLSFSKSLSKVPNRGSGAQSDIFLNGVPYLQSINDVTISQETVGIHFEPGLWMAIPPTQDPTEGSTVVRMASIPHGATILAQGTSRTFNGPPTIPQVDITPVFLVNGKPGTQQNRFPSQTAADQGTTRIPQDLTSWINAGTITQEMIDDPNSLLRNVINKQVITSTTEISISTQPSTPLFGNGTSNIAFLQGDAATQKPNADTFLMTATFWIETVEHTLRLPILTPGQAPLKIVGGVAVMPGQPLPTFIVEPPPHVIREIRMITVHSTQIQYSQTVILNFNGLAWPHVSVSTLVPADNIMVPPSAWDAIKL